VSNYEDDKEYAREIYWESKGMGKTRPVETPITLAGVEMACPFCGRVKDKALVERHMPMCTERTGE